MSLFNFWSHQFVLEIILILYSFSDDMNDGGYYKVKQNLMNTTDLNHFLKLGWVGGILSKMVLVCCPVIVLKNLLLYYKWHYHCCEN